MTQNVTVTVHVKEIEYDEMDKTNIAGSAHEASGDKSFESVSMMQASDTERYHICRSISNAYAELKSELSEYLSDTKTETDNKIIETVENQGELILVFEMPSNYQTSATEALGYACHQYIVNKAIGGWYLLTNKAEAADYVAFSTAALEAAKKAILKRTRPTREEED